MKINFISYGYKHYEGEGLAPPAHDFLFSLRDIANPFWVDELKEFCGIEKPIIDFFKVNDSVQERLEKIQDLVLSFVRDFCANKNRKDEDSLTFAFRCTGGRHRSVYFAEQVCDFVSAFDFERDMEFETEHVDLGRHYTDEQILKIMQKLEPEQKVETV